VRAVYRRWDRPRVKPGSSFRTSIGVVAVDAVTPIALSAITEQAAREAGFSSRAELVADLERHGEGRSYRVALRLEGPDPRVRLRHEARLSASEIEELSERIAQLGARTREGPWGLAILRLIAERPGVRAPDLAASMRMDVTRFKPRVRQLKELGLTESLEVGYRLSPRGRALLDRIGDRGGAVGSSTRIPRSETRRPSTA
jgi:hypothetical protein